MELTVEDVMERDVHAIHCQCSVAEAETKLSHHRISGLPMVSAEGQILGVVSMTDIVRFRSEHKDADPEQSMVYEIGTPETITVHAETPLREAASLFVKNRIHRLVVVRKGVPIGIVSTFDIVDQYARGRS